MKKEKIQNDDMLSIEKNIKKELRKKGEKISKTELNNMVIARMNKPNDEEIQQAIDSQKVGTHEHIKYVTDKYYMRRSQREIIFNNGKKLNQFVFTDYDINFKDFDYDNQIKTNIILLNDNSKNKIVEIEKNAEV